MQILAQAKSNLEKYPWLPALFFLLLVITLRLGTFYQAVLNWDESLYLLVADEWLRGNPPYTTIWDNKPPGIYAIFALGLQIFGHTIFSIRIAACLFIAIGCYFLYLTGRSIPGGNTLVGLIAGSLYAIVTLNNSGNAANTEAFYITFTIAALAIILLGNFHVQQPNLSNYRRIFFAGLLLGIGFEIKYAALFDFVAAAVILTLSLLIRSNYRHRYLTLLKSLAVLTIGFLIPFLLVSLYFLSINLFGAYSYANFAANKARTVQQAASINLSLEAILEQIRTYSPLWFSTLATPIYLLLAKRTNLEERWALLHSFIWFLVVLLCMVAVFRVTFYYHYFLQLVPAMCLIAAFWLGKLVSASAQRSRRERTFYTLSAAFFLLLLVLNQNISQHLIGGMKSVYFTHIRGIRNWADQPAQASEYIKQQIKPGDYIYVANYEPILYFLSNSKIPSKYAAHPPFLIPSVDFPSITTVNPLQELAAIMQKKPVFVIWCETEIRQYTEAGKRYLEELKKYLSRDYVLDKSIAATPSPIYLHKRKNSSEN